MTFRDFIILRLGGEDAVRNMAAANTLREPLLKLMYEISVESARVTLTLPYSEEVFETFLGNYIGTYRQGAGNA